MSNGQTNKFSGLSTGFKEVVSACLGVAIIAAVLILMWPSLSKSPPDTASAQGIFAILGGWGGVILGYYFGRLPSEKMADKASLDANGARRERDVAEKTKTFVLANSINLLDNCEKSLQSQKEKLKQLTQQPHPAAGLDIVINEIDAEIAEIGTEKQKFLDMAK